MPDLDYGYEVTIQTPATSDPAASSVTNQWQRQISGNTKWEDIAGSSSETYKVTAGDRSAKLRLQQDLNGAKAYSNELQVTSDNPSVPPNSSSSWSAVRLDAFSTTESTVYSWGLNNGKETHLVAQYASWTCSPDAQTDWSAADYARLNLYSASDFEKSSSSDGEDWFFVAGLDTRLYRKSGGDFDTWLRQSGSYSGSDQKFCLVTRRHYVILDTGGRLFFTSKSSANSNYTSVSGLWASVCYNKELDLYFATSKDTGDVHKSEDLSSWTDLGFNAGGSGYMSGVVADRGGKNIIFTFNSMSKTMYKSINGGSSWIAIDMAGNYGPTPYEFAYDSRMPGEYKSICYFYAKGFAFLKENSISWEMYTLDFLNPSKTIPVIVDMTPHQFILMLDGSDQIWSTKYA